MSRIRRIIEEAEMTQKNFAEFIGIPIRTVEDWCRDVRKCPKYVEDLIEFRMNESIITRSDLEISNVDTIKFSVETSNNDTPAYFSSLKQAKEEYETIKAMMENEEIEKANIYLEMITINEEGDETKTIYLEQD